MTLAVAEALTPNKPINQSSNESFMLSLQFGIGSKVCGPAGVLQSDTRNNWSYSGYFTTGLCVVVLSRDRRVGPYYM